MPASMRMNRGHWLVLAIVIGATFLALVALKLRPPPPAPLQPATQPDTRDIGNG